jgi:hypothetical protein
MDARTLMTRVLACLTVVVMLAGCATGVTNAPPSTTPAPATTARVATAPPSSTASPDPTAAAKVTPVSGTGTCHPPTSPYSVSGYVTDVSDVLHFRRGSLLCTTAADDPRVSGAVTAQWNADQWGAFKKGQWRWAPDEDGAFVQWGTRRIENAGGAWEGMGPGVYSADRGNIIVTWYRGTGAYAGLGYFELLTGPTTALTIRGQVFPGDPPNLAGLPPVTGPVPSPSVSDTPMPVPPATPGAIAYGPVSVVEGYSEYTVVDIGNNIYAGRDTVNDPRVNAEFLAPSWTLHFWGATGDSLESGTQWGATRLSNAGGAWQGVGSGILDEGGDVIAQWYKGTGGYAGLSYFQLLARPDLFGPNPGVNVTGVFGQVFPGDPPTP